MTRLERWESRTRTPLMVLALIFLFAFAIPIVAPSAPQNIRSTCQDLQFVVWVVFASDYAIRLLLSDQRWHFIRHHLVDLAAVTIPALRPLRLVAALAMVQQQAGEKLRGHVAAYVALSVTLVVTISALAVLDVEREAGGNIETWQDALWWAMVTITTVGYGDFYPTTNEGRLYALGLMLCGIALLGIVTASLSSWLLEKVSDTTEQSQAETAKDLSTLTAMIAELRDEVAALRAERTEPRHAAGPLTD